MPSDLLLRGARLLDPARGLDTIGDLGIRDGRFAEPGQLQNPEVVDLAGCIVLPGFVDLHVHLREPGQSHKETIETGTRAAAAGGFTTILAMPNTAPAIDTPERIHAILGEYRKRALVRVLQSAALTMDRKGLHPVDAGSVKAAGAAALTDDGSCIQDTAVMREILRRAGAAGLPVIDHCENYGLAAGGTVRTGPVAERLGVRGMPAAAEDAMVERDIALAAELGVSVHLQHLSGVRSVELVREARRAGTPVTAEVTPHHLCLTAESCFEHGAQAKMNPPLGTDADRQALIAALADGTFGAIATDHAPHAPEEKARGLATAPFGIIGLETAFAILYTELVLTGVLPLARLVAALTTGPARILGLDAGTLAPGRPADVTVLDPAAAWTVSRETLHSKSVNTPFLGRRLTGRIVRTMVGGRWVFRHEDLTGPALFFPPGP